jgi:hypothetical protein
VEEGLLTDYVLDQFDSGGASSPPDGRFLIPVTVDDLAANGLLEPPPAPAGQASQVCWERSVETLNARKDDLQGFAVATDEGIEAYLLYRALDGGAEVAGFRSLIDDGGAYLANLLAPVLARGPERAWFPKVHPAEVSVEWLERLGFRPAGAHRLFSGIARQE